jgi:RNA polymerase sigma-70 factor, ECF subfamily
VSGVSGHERHTRFNELFRSYSPAVTAYFRRRHARTHVDDLVAEVFTVVWRKLETVPDEPLPYLYGIARRVLANHRRGNDRRSALAAALQGVFHGSVTADIADTITEDDQVRRALMKLRASDIEVLLLSAWEGLDGAALADALGVSVSAANSRLNRAKNRFKKALLANDNTD